MSILDEIYGYDNDVDELAEAEFFMKTAEAAGIDVDDLNDDEVAYLYQKVAEATEDVVDEDEDEDEEEAVAEALADAIEEEQAKESGYYDYEDEFEEKVAEADYLGRVMAHAQVEEFEKLSGARWDKVIKYVHEAPGKLTGSIGRGLERVGVGSRRVLKGKKQTADYSPEFLNKVVRKAKRKLYGTSGAAPAGKYSPKEEGALINKMLRRSDMSRGAAVLGGGAGLAGLGGYGAYKGLSKKKQSSAEDYVYGRAIEKLAERGWDVDELLGY